MKEIIDLFSLDGKNAVITGGAGVLCSAIGKALGSAGAKIALCDINDTSNSVKLLSNHGICAKGYYIDVTDLNSIKKCKSEIIKDFENIDILVNGAGGNMKAATTSEELSFFDIPVEAFQKVINLNLMGTILPSQVFGKTMANNPNGGSIINISSINSYRPLTRIAGYAASKAAISNFTQWLAVHFAMEYNKKLRVNAIAPGFFLTEQLKYLHFNEDGSLTERAKKVLSHIPMGDYGSEKDLAGACIWLASGSSSYVTGSIITIDGGLNSYSGI